MAQQFWWRLFMNKQPIGNSGDTSTGIIIPVGQSQGSTSRIFPHILDAISQIQQFYVIEASGQEIPDDFLTIRGKLNFFNVGFGAGFLEALIFALLMSLILILCSDNATRQTIAKYFPMINSNIFLWVINLLPVIISGGLCSYLSHNYVGKITRKAIDSFLLGRVFSMIIKGLLLCFFMIWVSNCINPHSAWNFSQWVSLKKYDAAIRIYYIILSIKPLLIKRAYELLAVFGLAVIMPFLFIWGIALIRKIKASRDNALMEV
jgi:hypothetical protein